MVRLMKLTRQAISQVALGEAQTGDVKSAYSMGVRSYALVARLVKVAVLYAV